MHQLRRKRGYNKGNLGFCKMIRVKRATILPKEDPLYPTSRDIINSFPQNIIKNPRRKRHIYKESAIFQSPSSGVSWLRSPARVTRDSPIIYEKASRSIACTTQTRSHTHTNTHMYIHVIPKPTFHHFQGAFVSALNLVRARSIVHVVPDAFSHSR